MRWCSKSSLTCDRSGGISTVIVKEHIVYIGLRYTVVTCSGYTIELTGLLLVLEIIVLSFPFAKMLKHILAPFMLNGPYKVAQL